MHFSCYPILLGLFFCIVDFLSMLLLDERGFMNSRLTHSVVPSSSRESSYSYSLVSRTLAFVLSFVLIFLLSVPSSFAQMLASPVYFSGRVYPLTLASEGSPLAGLKGRSYEYITQATTDWTSLIADIQDGNLLFTIHPLQLPGTLLPLNFNLTWNAFNADVDIGLGKGWTSNLHSTITEDQDQNLLLVTGTGAKLLFLYDANTQSYINPPSFTGKIEKLPNGSYRITSLDGSSQTFSSNGKLSSFSPPCGDATLTVTYDGNGRPTSLSDTLSSRAITLAWDQNGYLSEVEDMLENTWAFTYDQDQHLTTLTQPGETTPPSASFSYNSTSHLLETHTDFEGFDYNFTYYTSGAHEGKLESWADSLSNTWVLAYDTSIQGYASKTTVTDGANIDTDYYFGSTSLALEKTSMGTAPDDIYHVFAYNSDGWLTSSINPMGHTTSYSYDSVGHLTEISYPPATAQDDPFRVLFTYTPSNSLSGKLTESKELISGSTWNTTTLAYTDQNAPCLPSSITNALNESISISYNSHAQASEITYPTGTAFNPSTGTMSFSYHPTSYLPSQVTDAENNASTMSYNANGLPVQTLRYEGPVISGVVKGNTSIIYDVVSMITDKEDTVTGTTFTATFTNNGAISAATNDDCGSTTTFTTTTSNNDAAVRPSPPIRFTPTPGGVGGIDLTYRPLAQTRTGSTGYTTTYDYLGDGNLSTSTDHLDRETSYSYDSFGRVDTISYPNATQTEYTYDKNSRLVNLNTSAQGDTVYGYDNAGRLTSLSDPIQGNLSFTYNLRGDLLTDARASYSYDLLGRGTQINYTGGGSDAWTYTRDGRIASKNLETLSYDKIGNITQWNSNGSDGSVSYGYTGTHGSKALGLPSASTGTGNIGSYAFTYNTKYLLHTMADTSKIAQSYTYSYSTANQITGLLYPNQTSTSYIYDNKQLDSIQVQQLNVNPPINWLATDSTYNSDGQRTAYSFSVTNGQGGSFAESHDFDYDTAGRMTSVDYQNTQRTVDFSYNASTGLMNELDYSDLGTYTLSHDTAGRLSSVTYPDTSQESYTYQGGLGRLSQIQYPNNQSLGFSWNSQGQVSQLQVNDNGTLSSYAFNYNTRGKLASYSKTVGGITTEQWYLFHGPQGMEKAQRLGSGGLNLTLDFTTDPRGNILSMTHTPSGGAQGFTGEVYFHYDNAGNTSLLTNASGVPLASFQHDPISGIAINEWNPQNITFPWIGGGSAGGITLKPFPGKDLWISFDAYQKWQAMQKALKAFWDKIGKATSSSSIDGCCNEFMCWCNPCDERSEENYYNCMSNCFATDGESTSTERNQYNVDKWECWKSARDSWNVAKGILAGIGISVGVGIIAAAIIAGLEITITKGLLTTIITAVLTLLAGAALATLISSVTNWWQKMQQGNLWVFGQYPWDWEKTMDVLNKREQDCREKCDKYNPW
jgi:YD repeat-containing protein